MNCDLNVSKSSDFIQCFFFKKKREYLLVVNIKRAEMRHVVDLWGGGGGAGYGVMGLGMLFWCVQEAERIIIGYFKWTFWLFLFNFD